MPPLACVATMMRLMRQSARETAEAMAPCRELWSAGSVECDGDCSCACNLVEAFCAARAVSSDTPDSRLEGISMTAGLNDSGWSNQACKASLRG